MVALDRAITGSIGEQWRLLFAKRAGSKGYNLALDTSDNDYVGVFVMPVECHLAVSNSVPESLAMKSDNDQDDICAHEARHFCKILLKCNMNVLEILFTPPDKCYAAPVFKELMQHRMKFVTHRAVQQCVGMSKKLLKGLDSLTDESVIRKRLYIILRTLYSGVDMAGGDAPCVWFTEVSERRDYILGVRAGQYTTHQVIQAAEGLLATIEGAKPWPIPMEPEGAVLDEWLCGVYL